MEGLREIHFAFAPLDQCQVPAGDQKAFIAIQATSAIVGQYLAYLAAAKATSGFSPKDLADVTATVYSILKG